MSEGSSPAGATQSALESTPLVLSTFRHAEDPNPPHRLEFPSWRAFVHELQSTGHHVLDLPELTADQEREVKKAQPLICPATFRGEKRINEHAQAVGLGIIDLDHKSPAEFYDILQRLNSTGLEYFVYTSWSHGLVPGEWAARVMFPFSHAVPASEWTSFWPKMEAATVGAGNADAKCKNVARGYFAPVVPRLRLASACMKHHEGAPLDVDALDVTPAVIIMPGRTVRKTHADLVNLAGKKKLDGWFLEMVSAASKGEAIVQAGSGTVRDTLLAYTWKLASLWPNADAASVEDLHTRSLSILADHDRALGNNPFTLTNFREMFESALRKLSEGRTAEPWWNDLGKNAEGQPERGVGNAVIVLENHRDLVDTLAWDARRLKAVWRGDAPWKGEHGCAGKDVTDPDFTLCAKWFTRDVRISISSRDCAEAMYTVARNSYSFDPVQDYLRSLVWDRVPRINEWLITYAHAPAANHVRAVGAKWLISAVARAMKPGCKVDTMLILEGDQGTKKSSMLRTLTGGASWWFTDHLGAEITTRDGRMSVHKPWIIELAELEAFNKKDATQIKAFLTVQDDDFRLPYGKTNEHFPRSCVFAGSTNSDHYLQDPTGGRRFWPVRVVGLCDVEGIERDRDQLWAEAVARYTAGEPWWFTDAESYEATAVMDEQAARHAGDPWEDTLRVALDRPTRAPGLVLDVTGGLAADVAGVLRLPQGEWTTSVTGAEALTMVGVDVERQTPTMVMRVSAVLRRLGWIKAKTMIKGVRAHRYYRPGCEPMAGLGGGGTP